MATIQDIQRLQDQIVTLFKDATDSRSRVSQLENSLSETRGKQEGTESKLSDTESKLSDTERRLADTEKRCADTVRKLADTEKRCADTERRLADTEKRCADTERKLADTKRKLKDAQKKQTESERKLEDYKKELTETRARLLENESKFEDWKAKQEKNSKKIEDKVQLNSKEILTLTMLKSIFKGSLIGKARRFLNQDEMENMEARLDQVDRNLTVVHTKGDEHSEQMENMEAIVKEVDRNLTVVHKNGDELSKKIKTIQGETGTLKADVTGLCKARDQHSQEIQTLDGKQTKLNADVTGLQKTVDHHSTKLKSVRMHYHSKICRQTEVDHDGGVLKFRNDPNETSNLGTFMALQPLSQACPSFSVEIVSKGIDAYWGWYIGLAPMDWDEKRGMGAVRGGVGYYDDGWIFDSKKEVHDSSDARFTVGDIIKVMLTSSPTAVTFSKNGKTVLCQPLDPGVFSINNQYPAILLGGKGTAVRLLEADPWRA